MDGTEAGGGGGVDGTEAGGGGGVDGTEAGGGEPDAGIIRTSITFQNFSGR